MNQTLSLFNCPICSSPLPAAARLLTCPNGHCFDLAREGYVNLLPANRKKSTNPGDSPEMLQARKRFLEAGHYDFLADTLYRLIETRLTTEARFLDAGCGEGYFTRALRPLPGIRCGIDISKQAVRMAAKADPDGHYATASNFALPIANDSQDFILRILAPGSPEEVSRCLKNDGQFILVTPGPKHLQALREALYANPEPQGTGCSTPTGFELIDRKEISTSVELNNPGEMDALLKMTPFHWHGQAETKAHLQKQQTFSTPAQFIISRYKKIQ